VTLRTFRTWAAAALYRTLVNNCSIDGSNRWTCCHSKALCGTSKQALIAAETLRAQQNANAMSIHAATSTTARDMSTCRHVVDAFSRVSVNSVSISRTAP
jgi:hypothetical protein